MSPLRRAGLALLGVAIMWVESRYTDTPGMGFALALGLMVWAALEDGK